jgi:ClpP class serine protease
VAAGRGKDRDAIHEVAQGRVWTGIDGLDKGLVDEIGGLEAAIKLARKEAGYEEDELSNVYEYPKPTFDLGGFLGGLVGFNLNTTVEKANLLKFRAENNGVPMPLVPIDFWQYYVTE